MFGTPVKLEKEGAAAFSLCHLILDITSTTDPIKIWLQREMSIAAMLGPKLDIVKKQRNRVL